MPRASRIGESGAGVLRETAAMLHAEFAGHDWLTAPAAFALRAAR